MIAFSAWRKEKGAVRIHGEATGMMPQKRQQAGGGGEGKAGAGGLTSVLAASVSASVRPAVGKESRGEQAQYYSMEPPHAAAEAQTRLEARTTDPNSALRAESFVPSPPSVSQTWSPHQLH